MEDALDNEQVEGVFQRGAFVRVMTAGRSYRNIGHPYMEINSGFTIIPPRVRQDWLDTNVEVARGLYGPLETGAQYPAHRTDRSPRQLRVHHGAGPRD